MNQKKQKVKDGLMNGAIWLSAIFTVAILTTILGFILYKGLPGINLSFLTRMWDSKTTFVNVTLLEGDDAMVSEGQEEVFIPQLGAWVTKIKDGFQVEKISGKFPLKDAVTLKKQDYPVKKQDIIVDYQKTDCKDLSLEEFVMTLNQSEGTVRMKMMRPGGGILPMMISTVYLILLSLVIAVPIGICCAIYLCEYARPGRMLNIIRFAIQNLAGIPSIIYGLFGMLVFVQMMHMKYSILAGAMTMSILLLPTIITTTEETLRAIPVSLREASLGLGATKIQTIAKVVLPNAVPGIMVAVILSIGRIVGESAALIWTAGTVAQIPTALTGNEASAATMTTKLYWLIKESGDLSQASSIAVIILVLIIFLNLSSKQISKRCQIKG